MRERSCSVRRRSQRRAGHPCPRAPVGRPCRIEVRHRRCIAMIPCELVTVGAVCACAIAMAVAVVCDLRTRTIPVAACAVLAIAGTVFRACEDGVEGVAAGAVCGIIVVAGCRAANRLFRRDDSKPIGSGDIRCMGALSLASGAYAPLGFAACYGAAACAALVGLASRRISLQDGMPMAPFLALWLACAALCR
ncbi:A24 family peptidase [Enteroscipio rubneri]